MKLYYFMFKENEHEYIKVEESKTNTVGLEPANHASKEAIQAIYRFNVECEDETNQVAYDAEELSKRMIERFKASNCYKFKSETERKEIIQYLKDTPDVNNPFIDLLNIRFS